jgi:hypothetical protein
MKTKNILMTLLLVTGAIAAKANGFPPELALVSQPVMVYNYNSITVYYDVENIGDYTYRGDICIFLDPDDGYSYAEEYVKVRPGRIKRIAVEIPSYRIDRHFTYTIMPYYTIGRELYSFTTFEYFEPIRFCWHGPRTEPWVVIHIGPRLRYYHRPGTYRYYYDGFRPPMPPPGHGPGMPPPMDPMHHTYGYHHNNGGYPATHNNWNDTPEPKPNGNEPAPSATVRPKTDGGSMSSGTYNNGSTVAPNNSNSNDRPRVNSNSGRTGNGTSTRPNINSGASTGSATSGRTGNNGSGRVSGSNSNSRPGGTSGSSSGRVNNSNSNTRNSGTNGSSSGRVNNSNSNTRNSGTNGSSSSRVNNSSSNTRNSGTSSSSSRSGDSSTRSSSSRSGSGNGRR